MATNLRLKTAGRYSNNIHEINHRLGEKSDDRRREFLGGIIISHFYNESVSDKFSLKMLARGGS